MMGGGLVNAALALALVIGLIYALAWLLRRLPGQRLRGNDGLRIISSIPLGSKERAVLLDINGEQLLLGVAPGAVSLLHRLPAAEESVQ